MLMRCTYKVTGTVKFLSHLDLLKLFNKTINRGQIPIAYSEGFNPHPKISFGPPRGVAIAGLMEYCDMKLKTEMKTQDFIEAMNNALPKGIEITDAYEVVGKAEPLMAVINLSTYECEIQDENKFPEVQTLVDDFLKKEEVPFTRVHPKKGEKIINLRAGVKDLTFENGKIKMSIPSTATGSIKPAELLTVLLPKDTAVLLTRTAMYVEKNGEIKRP